MGERVGAKSCAYIPMGTMRIPGCLLYKELSTFNLSIYEPMTPLTPICADCLTKTMIFRFGALA
jgi:hypothetical protein